MTVGIMAPSSALAIVGIGIEVRGLVIPVGALRDDQASDLSGFGETVGIRSVHDSGEDDGVDLSRAAAERGLIDAGIAPEDVDVFVHVRSRVPAAFISSECGRLQHELGLTNSVGFSLSDLGCADTSMALQIATDRLRANPELAYGLVTYGHCKYTSSRIRNLVTVHGDGAAAAVIGYGPGLALVAAEHIQNGRYWDLFQVPFRDRTADNYTEVCQDQRVYSLELAIESQRQFSVLNDRMMQKTGVGFDNADHVILQNISARAFQFYEGAFGMSIMPVCQHNLSRFGHLGGADILVNLGVALENGMIRRGQRVLVMNNSPTAAWSLTLLEMTAGEAD